MLSCAPAPMWVLEKILKDMFHAVTIKSSLDYYENMEETQLSEKCDILILPYAPEDDKIKSAKIFEERLLLSVPPAHPLPSFVSNITLDIRKDPNRVTVPIRDDAAKAEFYCCWRKAGDCKFKGLADRLCEYEIRRAIQKLHEQ